MEESEKYSSRVEILQKEGIGEQIKKKNNNLPTTLQRIFRKIPNEWTKNN